MGYSPTSLALFLAIRGIRSRWFLHPGQSNPTLCIAGSVEKVDFPSSCISLYIMVGILTRKAQKRCYRFISIHTLLAVSALGLERPTKTRDFRLHEGI